MSETKERPSDPEAASILARVEAATKRAPLAATRKCELAAALLWLIDMARASAEAEEGDD